MEMHFMDFVRKSVLHFPVNIFTENVKMNVKRKTTLLVSLGRLLCFQNAQ